MSFNSIGQLVVLLLAVHYSEQTWTCHGIFQPYPHDLRCYVEIVNSDVIIRKSSDGVFFDKHTCGFENILLHPNLHYGHSDDCQKAVMGNTVYYTEHHHTDSQQNHQPHHVPTNNWEDMCRYSNGDQIIHSLDNCDSVLTIWDILHSIRSHQSCLINVITKMNDKYHNEHVSNCTCSQSRYHLSFVNLNNGLYQSCRNYNTYMDLLRHVLTNIPYTQHTGDLYCKSHHYVWSYLHTAGVYHHDCMVDAIDHMYVALHHHGNNAVCSCDSQKVTVPTTTTATLPPAITSTPPPTTTIPVTTPTTTQHVDAFFCRECTDYFTQACTSSTFDPCSSGNCMIKHSYGKLAMKCVEHSACQLQQISDQLTPGSKTTCCGDNACTLMALQVAIQNQLHTTTTTTTEPTTTSTTTTTTTVPTTTTTTTTVPTTTRLSWVTVPTV